MEIAKALVLVGRTAHDRPWPSVRSGPKHLVPVANRPILFHNLEALRRAGMLEATIALEPESAQPIMAAVGDGSAWNLAVRYVRWAPGTGVGGALAAARKFLVDEPVLVEPADALHRQLLHPHISAFADERLDALALHLPGAPCSGAGEPVAGAYLLSRHAVALLLEDPSAEPIAGVRRRGGDVSVRASDGCLPCHGGQDRLLEGNRRMLEELVDEVDPTRYPSCEFQGPVRIHPTAQLDHTLVRGPAVIGPGAQLSHAYVGPYTSIGARVSVDGSEVEHSILLEGSALPTAMRLSVGDGAEVTVT